MSFKMLGLKVIVRTAAQLNRWLVSSDVSLVPLTLSIHSMAFTDFSESWAFVTALAYIARLIRDHSK